MTLQIALRRQSHVIYALLTREIERRRKNPSEAVMAIFEPLIVIGVMSFFWYTLNRHANVPLGRSVVLFHAVSILPFYFFVYISRRSIKDGAATPKRRFPSEQRLDHIFVSILFRIFDYLILGVLFFSVLYAFGIQDAKPANLFPIVEAAAAVVMIGFGWGMFNFVIRDIFPIWKYLNIAITRGLLLFSGLWFLPEHLEPGLRYVLSFNPLLQVIELCRLGFYPNYRALIVDRAYLSYCALFAVLIGLVVERLTRRNEGQPRRAKR